MEQRISLVTLGVRDLARACAFYEALGWRGAQQPDDEVAFYQAGGIVFGLWAALGGHGAPGVELAHNVPSPEEVDVLLADAERAGGTPNRPAQRAPWGASTGAFPELARRGWGGRSAEGVDRPPKRSGHIVKEEGASIFPAAEWRLRVLDQGPTTS